MTFLVLLVILGFIVWFWQDSVRTKELAKAACLRACRSCRVQLLDDTVALEKLWLRRNNTGRLCLERRYVFEFTDNGVNRIDGIVVLLGRRVEILAMDGDDLLVL